VHSPINEVKKLYMNYLSCVVSKHFKIKRESERDRFDLLVSLSLMDCLCIGIFVSVLWNQSDVLCHYVYYNILKYDDPSWSWSLFKTCIKPWKAWKEPNISSFVYYTNLKYKNPKCIHFVAKYTILCPSIKCV